MRKKKRAKVERVPEKEKEEKYVCFLCNNISNYRNCLYQECLRMSLNDNSKILEKKTTKMEMMKTNKNKNRKALWTHDQKKMTVTMVALVEVVVSVVVSVALRLVKQRSLKVEVAVLVEMVARAGVVVLIVVENSWGQGEIC